MAEDGLDALVQSGALTPQTMVWMDGMAGWQPAAQALAFATGIDDNIERAGKLKTMVFGGEGLFLATLQGHGTLWLQSLPLARLAGRIIAGACGGKSTGEGSVLGGLANLFEQ